VSMVVYIQCPHCQQFTAKNTYNASTRNFRCPSCGPFSEKTYKESKHQLVCHEINYGPRGTDLPFDKALVKSLPKVVVKEVYRKTESYQETAKRLGVPEIFVKMANRMVLQGL